jgi:outer membrane protein
MKTKHVMLIKHIVLILLGILSYAAFGQSASMLSIEDCINMALGNNKQLKNSKLEAEASEYRIKEVKSALLPTTDLNGQYQYYMVVPSQYAPATSFGGPEGEYKKLTLGLPQTTGLSLQTTQQLFNQSVFTGLKAAKAVREASEMQVSVTQEDLIHNVSATYYTIQVLQDNLGRLADNIDNLEKTVKINESLMENELVAANIHSRLLINLENLKNQYEHQRLAKDKNLTLLQYLMNTEDSVSVEPFNYEAPLDIPGAANINERYDIRLQQINIRIAEFDKKSVVAGYFPTLVGGMSYGYTGYYNEFSPGKAINSDWINSSAFSLSLKIPVFDGFQKHYKIRQRDVTVRKQENALSMMKSNAEREVQDAINNYNTSANQLSNNRKSLDLAEQLFNSAQREFESGITSSTELLNAQTDLSNARTNYSTALLNLKLAELSWKKASGTLSKEYTIK